MSVVSTPRLQVLLRASPGAPSVAGLPCSVRAAFRAGKELRPERIVIAGADEAFLRRWTFQLEAAGAPVLGGEAAGALDASLPVLAVAADAFPDENALSRFLASARNAGEARAVLNGRVVASFGSSPDAEGPELPADGFFDAGTPDSAAASAEVLYSRLAKDNDGYIARLDRRLSLLLTRLMLPLPITPNQVTAISLAVGLLGAWWLAAPSPLVQLRGAMALWLCALLDGCDGEIARLKHHATPWGGTFDVLADHVAHLATFVALPVGVARLHPGVDWHLPGVLLVTGFIACGASVYWLVLRVPEEQRGPLALVVERVASRDYVYLIAALAAIGRLDWFVWAAACGSHAFWAWLWWLSAREAEAELEPERVSAGGRASTIPSP